jgi:hypothetical protein
MLAALPVGDRNDPPGRLVDIGNDHLGHQGSDQPLTRSRRGLRHLPGCREVIGQFREVGVRGIGIWHPHIVGARDNETVTQRAQQMRAANSARPPRADF